ncbi:hypothetical protein SPACI_051560 [Sporomusa acidovorans DSM 3132]|uniref:Glycosyl hydrolase family 32 N-terminal domain-containing protein n=2 Tax=Sporomusa TaxID=2375 RepID=A0ABZ3JA80_SPOA4|nr:hypothetical protein [Sporomusa acidovorans]OZC15139.1 hypothetical protein SPACI_50510 [Sporomusa acidovorans DSM 3132]SDF44058.1 hypothetical protein SAMN04488499_104927 [Sporomusa acidovorans]
MKWDKMGKIYTANGQQAWAYSHAMIPTPELLGNGVIRMYITFCNKQGIGRIGFVDIDAKNPEKVLAISSEPLLDKGQPGCFDENGVVATSIVTLADGKKLLYYVGFELGTKIRYRLLTGLAVSDDGGQSFSRVQRTPVLERSNTELYFRCGPFVLYENQIFRMWYVAGDQWITINGKEMPVYTINYLESKDGVTWGPKGKVCIDIAHKGEHGFGRPYLIKHDGKYKMFYSIRVPNLGYRLGYAESQDGIDWQRKDDEIGLDVSPTGWDSEMVCYSAVIAVNNKYMMFYNGNNFGQTGFGWAEFQEW